MSPKSVACWWVVVVAVLFIARHATADELWVNAFLGPSGDKVGCGTSDNPCGSIGYAMSTQPTGKLDIVLVEGGVFDKTTDVNLFVGSQNVSIRPSDGQKATVIDCGGKSRFLKVLNSDKTERSVLQVGLHALTFTNCAAPVGEEGGVLKTHGIVTTTVTDCNFNNNRATYGGAISVTHVNNPSPRRMPVLLLSGDNVFFNNSASFKGGAIFSNYSTINITGTAFESNSATIGGGIHWLSSYRLYIAHSVFKSNRANQGSTDGGSALFATSASTITIDDVTFDSNFAQSPGTVALYFGPSATITRSTFRNNQARGGGGGLFCGSSTRCTVSTTSFTSNNGARGGGIYVNNAQLIASQLTMTGNTGAFGGGVHFSNARGHVSHSTFDGNVCEDGAAIYASNECYVTLAECVIRNNHARDEGSGLFCDKSTYSLSSLTFSNNTAGTTRSSSLAQDVYCDTAEANGYCYLEGDAQWLQHCKLVKDNSPRIPMPKWLIATIIALSVFVFLLVLAVAFWMYRVRRVRHGSPTGAGRDGYAPVEGDEQDDNGSDTQLFGVITDPNRLRHDSQDSEFEDDGLSTERVNQETARRGYTSFNDQDEDTEDLDTLH